MKYVALPAARRDKEKAQIKPRRILPFQPRYPWVMTRRMIVIRGNMRKAIYESIEEMCLDTDGGNVFRDSLQNPLLHFGIR